MPWHASKRYDVIVKPNSTSVRNYLESWRNDSISLGALPQRQLSWRSSCYWYVTIVDGGENSVKSVAFPRYWYRVRKLPIPCYLEGRLRANNMSKGRRDAIKKPATCLDEFLNYKINQHNLYIYKYQCPLLCKTQNIPRYVSFCLYLKMYIKFTFHALHT